MRAMIAAIVATAMLAGCGDEEGRNTVLKLSDGFFAGSRLAHDAPPSGNPLARVWKLSKGDRFRFEKELVDSSYTKVGELRVTCTAIKTAGRHEGGRFRGDRSDCTGQFLTGRSEQLGTADGGRGRLHLRFRGSFGGTTVRGSIVGGSGEYAGARGSFESVRTGGRDGRYHHTFQIRLP